MVWGGGYWRFYPVSIATVNRVVSLVTCALDAFSDYFDVHYRLDFIDQLSSGEMEIPRAMTSQVQPQTKWEFIRPSFGLLFVPLISKCN